MQRKEKKKEKEKQQRINGVKFLSKIMVYKFCLICWFFSLFQNFFLLFLCLVKKFDVLAKAEQKIINFLKNFKLEILNFLNKHEMIFWHITVGKLSVQLSIIFEQIKNPQAFYSLTYSIVF